MDLETTRNKYNDDFEDAVLDKRLALEGKRSRKRIKTIQTHNLNEEISAEIGCSSMVAEEDGNDNVADDLSNISREAEDDTDYIQKKKSMKTQRNFMIDIKKVMICLLLKGDVCVPVFLGFLISVIAHTIARDFCLAPVNRRM
ncbi:unnamed protein product [Rhizopus stolonifer]